jgi:DNA-(apurinic or apyrimidinic site) lyase (EC 4.2.99.18)/endonuclease III (EC 3.2.2.-)
MGEPADDPRVQAAMVIERLEEAYPDATISLEYRDRLELLIAVVLSAQCTDARVNQVTQDLFEKYRRPSDYAAATTDELAEDIYGITFHNSKAGYLQSIGERLLEEFDGEVPDTMADLTSLSGVGRKTANVVLQHGHDIVEGVVVDTHVTRLSRRLGLTDERAPEQIEADLMELLPRGHWQQLTHLFIAHGRAVCTAQNPSCSDCTLEDICPSSRLDHERDLAKQEPW